MRTATRTTTTTTNARAGATPSEGRDRVLRQARALFVERGYDGVSMQQIADAAGMTKAALYYHFKDKEDLFGQVMGRELDRVRLALAAALAEEGSLRDGLECVARQIFAVVQSDFGRLMSDVKEHVSAARQEAIGCHPDPPYDIIRPRLERAVAAGEVRPGLEPDLVLGCFFGMVFHRIGQAKLGRSTPPTEADAAAIVDVLLDGIATTPRGCA